MAKSARESFDKLMEANGRLMSNAALSTFQRTARNLNILYSCKYYPLLEMYSTTVSADEFWMLKHAINVRGNHVTTTREGQ